MVSEKAKKLILKFEGMDQPGIWPGGGSGITLGHGYDLGYGFQFEEDWGVYLDSDVMDRLKKAIGLKGTKAQEKAGEFRDIKIQESDADEVFINKTIPKYEDMTRSAFPGFDDLPEDAQGALVSLVYNRGSSMDDTDRRREMREIRDLVPLKDLQGIADKIREMKRLWIGKNLDGLLRRRDAEADLIESCI